MEETKWTKDMEELKEQSFANCKRPIASRLARPCSIPNDIPESKELKVVQEQLTHPHTHTHTMYEVEIVARRD